MQSPAPVKTELIRQALLAGRAIQLRLTGTSMMPTLWPGELVRVSPARVEELACGDVIVFFRDNRLTVHRIVRVDATAGELVIGTRGDTLPAADLPLKSSEVLGLVSAAQRFGTERAISRIPSLTSRFVARIVRRSDRFRHLLFRLHLKLSQNARSAERAW